MSEPSESAAAQAEQVRLIGSRLLGLRLREIRSRQGLQLPGAAAATGLSAAYLSELERGRKLATLETLLTIAAAYGMLVTDVLDGVYPFGSTARPSSVPEPPPDGRRR